MICCIWMNLFLSPAESCCDGEITQSPVTVLLVSPWVSVREHVIVMDVFVRVLHISAWSSCTKGTPLQSSVHSPQRNNNSDNKTRKKKITPKLSHLSCIISAGKYWEYGNRFSFTNERRRLPPYQERKGFEQFQGPLDSEFWGHRTMTCTGNSDIIRSLKPKL